MSREPDRERELAAAVVNALLREDYGNLSRRVRYATDGPVLDLPGCDLVIPLEPDGFLADFRITSGGPPLKLGDVECVIAAVTDGEGAGHGASDGGASDAGASGGGASGGGASEGGDADLRGGAGGVAFAEECRAALAALRLRDDRAVTGSAALHARPGLPGAIGYDALAAVMPDPACPVSAARPGLTGDDLPRYAPEFLPEFELNWVAVNKTAIASGDGGLPSWWPAPEQVGLPASLADTHDLLPVHPLTARLALDGIGGIILAPGTALRVRPTQEARTVAVTARPATHLTVPLPEPLVPGRGSGDRNAIEPATLTDGALVHQVLTAVLARERTLSGKRAPANPVTARQSPLRGSGGLDSVLLPADDSAYAHVGHRYLGCLIRRLPVGLAECHIVPVAALLAPDGAPDGDGDSGRLVIDRLAAVSGRSVTDLARAWFDLVFGVGVRLLVRYGIVLESRQRATALVLDPATGGLRLLVRDFAGTRISHSRLLAALGEAALEKAVPPAAQFRSEGMLTDSDEELSDAFTRTTVHQCAGAIAFGLARHGRIPRGKVLAMARDSLSAAIDAATADARPGQASTAQASASTAQASGDGPAAHKLRSRILMALRLPGEAVLTGAAGLTGATNRVGATNQAGAGSLTGPNYLRIPGGGW
ncbi:MAG TPA: IucA/IucC family protein [Trebonia sp.]